MFIGNKFGNKLCWLFRQVCNDVSLSLSLSTTPSPSHPISLSLSLGMFVCPCLLVLDKAELIWPHKQTTTTTSTTPTGGNGRQLDKWPTVGWRSAELSWAEVRLRVGRVAGWLAGFKSTFNAWTWLEIESQCRRRRVVARHTSPSPPPSPSPHCTLPAFPVTRGQVYFLLLFHFNFNSMTSNCALSAQPTRLWVLTYARWSSEASILVLLMNPFVCLCILLVYPFMASICLSILWPERLSNRATFSLSICLHTDSSLLLLCCSTVCQSECLSVRLSALSIAFPCILLFFSPSFCQSGCISVHMSICRLNHLMVCPFIILSACPFDHSIICPSVNLFLVCFLLSVCLLICFVCLSICSPDRLPDYASVCQSSVYPSVRLFALDSVRLASILQSTVTEFWAQATIKAQLATATVPKLCQILMYSKYCYFVLFYFI